jgi:3-deoxy-D-manno-octulosonic-acid transferase
MRLFYQIITGLVALLALPVILCLAARPKYRQRFLRRLGWGLQQQLAHVLAAAGTPTFWMHALSVGEVTSALPLVRGLRGAYPTANIVFSVATRSGSKVAHKLLFPHIDALIAAPLDIGPVVPSFLRVIRPDLFILVETDFWPHWLHCLAQQDIPRLLVNGRISKPSFQRYRRWAALFRPMFASFTLLSMQTAADAEKMIALGLDGGRVVNLGNLKFDTSQLQTREPDQCIIASARERYGFAAATPLWICGSTHAGEEAIIFQVFSALRTRTPDLQLLLAPRNIERGQDIVTLAGQFGLPCRRWSTDQVSQGPVLILDTIGELAACYAMADMVFVGGSLVAEGGHNPIEPAAVHVPVLFGPHMEDFSEIAATLVQSGGACQVASTLELQEKLQQILTDASLRRSMAEAGWQYVQSNRGVVRRHLQVINDLLSNPPVNR